MNRDPLFFDIETAPLPEDQLLQMLPEFDESDVRCGNLKDPEKIKAKIDEAREAQRRQFIDGAALHPMTGQIVAIGYGNKDCIGIYIDDEKPLIIDFMKFAEDAMNHARPLVGFNIFSFDLPFIIRRAWKHGIVPPVNLREGRYWHKSIVDLRDTWLMGERQPAKGTSGLDAICKFLGLGQKLGTGADFYKLTREEQTAYLEQDVKLTRDLYYRML